MGYDIGDVVWSKIGHYPYWPSVISFAPKTEMFERRLTKKNTNKQQYHVHFLADTTHGWVNADKVRRFEAEDTEEERAKEYR